MKKLKIEDFKPSAADGVCINCGEDMDMTWKYCPYCGNIWWKKTTNKDLADDKIRIYDNRVISF